jgi:DNA mismatch repair protein MutS2
VSDWRAAVRAFPRERTWLLPALHAVQHELRWIPADALREVASHLRVPLSEAYGVATHYPELKTFAHATPGVRNASVEFDLASLRPTYHLSIGLPGRSNALAIASRLGLQREVVERARQMVAPEALRGGAARRNPPPEEEARRARREPKPNAAETGPRRQAAPASGGRRWESGLGPNKKRRRRRSCQAEELAETRDNAPRRNRTGGPSGRLGGPHGRADPADLTRA